MSQVRYCVSTRPGPGLDATAPLQALTATLHTARAFPGKGGADNLTCTQTGTAGTAPASDWAPAGRRLLHCFAKSAIKNNHDIYFYCPARLGRQCVVRLSRNIPARPERCESSQPSGAEKLQP